MKCHVCGGELRSIITDMPFKLSDKTIAILKELPVMQCENCNEFVLDDMTMATVETILDDIDTSAELEIVKYAA